MGGPHESGAPSATADRAERVAVILRQLDGLPTLGSVATRLLAIGSPEDADIDEVVRLIESDPALTGRVLGMCRRSDLGISRNVTTVRRAVVMLGLEAVRSAALAVSVYEVMDGTRERWAAQDGDETDGRTRTRFDHTNFWRRSIAVACGASALAELSADDTLSPDDAFSAGVLHGIGALALELILPKSYGRALTLAETRMCNADEVEREVLGVDRFLAGKRLAEHWGLPGTLRDAIWLHAQPPESPGEPENPALVLAVGGGVALARASHLGWSGDAGMPPDLSIIAERLGVSEQSAMAVLDRLHETVADRCAAIGLDDTPSSELILGSLSRANRALGKLNAAMTVRAAKAEQRERVLLAVGAFHAAAAGAADPVAVVGMAAHTLMDLVGERREQGASVARKPLLGAVVQLDSSAPCRYYRFDDSGVALGRIDVDAPGPLAEIAQSTARGADAISSLSWMIESLADAPDIRRVRVWPIVDARMSGGVAPAVLLVHDLELAELDNASELALTSAWASAIHGEALRARSEHQAESLAEQARALHSAQTRLAEADSLTRLGEMTAGAAHEMNNPLTVISGRSQLLAQRLSEASDRSTALAIRSAAEDLSELISSLHLVASPPRSQTEALDLADVAQRASEQAIARANASGVRAGPVCPTTRLAGVFADADRELLTRALVELVLNAIEAAPGRPVEIDAEPATADGRLQLRVLDRGPGLSERALKHASDPFFSEKQAGRGTGLGLSRARALIGAFGGELRLRNAREGGAVAELTLRASRETARGRAA
ncbi:MAG: HDOD domain-containing protein [Planctomycetota bacterium]